MELTSPAFENNGSIPPKYTCQGDDINPALMVDGVPAEAKSLVLIMDDPDAVKPAGKVWDHWTVFNIHPFISEIPEDSVPQGGVEGINSGGSNGYQGPCPPDTEHAYVFRLYALDTELDLEEGATKEEVLKAIEGHILDQAELVGRYEKS